MPRENQPPPLFRSDHDRVLQGLRYPLTVQRPAAGADWQLIVPGGRSWRLHGGQATLTTGAAVANRLVGLQVSLAGAVLWRSVNTTAIAANGAGSAIFQRILNPVSAANLAGSAWVDIPDYWIPEGATLAPLASNIQAADQWSGIVLLVEERWGSDSDIELGRELDAEAQLEALAAATSNMTGG